MRSGLASFAILVAFIVAGCVQTPPDPERPQTTTTGMTSAAIDPAAVQANADIAYASHAGADAARNRLDVFTHPQLSQAPVIVFLHGGSWQRGDKRAVGVKPKAFVPAGFVTVSANYRFRPDVTLLEQAQDAADAVAWVRGNISRHGGDPDRIVLMGHSAGAHIVSVIATNPRFLASARVPRSAIVGVVSLDTGPYSVATQMQTTNLSTPYGQMLKLVFGDDEGVWREVSPMMQSLSGLPPFLVVSSDNRNDVTRQAIPFVDKLKAAGVVAEWYEADGLDHEGVNRALGEPGAPITERVLTFLEQASAR